MPLAVALLFAASAAAAAEPDAAPSASASDLSASFTWSAPPPCPTRAEVLARAEQLVGHPLKRAPGTKELVLVGEVQPLSNAKWELRATSGPKRESERSVSADSCDELADAMALFIAFSIDPDYATRGSSSPLAPGRATFADVPSSAALETAPPATPPPTGESSPPLPPPPKREPELSSSPGESGLPVRSGPSIGLAVGVLGAIWVGRLPGVAPGVVLHGALSLKPWVTALELGYFPAQRVVEGAAAGDISLATLSGSIGYALFDGLLTPYVGVELERMHGVGAVSQPDSGNIWLFAVNAGLRFSYPVQPALRLVLAGYVSALPVSARFHIEPDSELFRPARVGAELGLGAEFSLR